jgi:DNA-binding XRE family transcriptional regulator
MTQPDLLQLLRTKCAESSQAAVAKKLRYSASTINQVLKGSYNADLTEFLTRVDEVYGSTIVNCPLQGEITLGKCAYTQ